MIGPDGVGYGSVAGVAGTVGITPGTVAGIAPWTTGWGVAAALAWIVASLGVASSGGSSALRAARPSGPRTRPRTISVSPVKNNPDSQNHVMCVISRSRATVK